jgi:hypothetical protein
MIPPIFNSGFFIYLLILLRLPELLIIQIISMFLNKSRLQENKTTTTRKKHHGKQRK